MINRRYTYIKNKVTEYWVKVKKQIFKKENHINLFKKWNIFSIDALGLYFTSYYYLSKGKIKFLRK